MHSSRGWVVGIAGLTAAALLVSAAPAGTDSEVAGILGRSLAGTRAYERLAWLCDRIGHRLSGSEALDRAIEWSVAEMEKDGLDRVWTEPVEVPHWERGDAEATIVAPVEWPIALLALGGSVPTPPEGIVAEVVEVDSFETLDRLGDAVAGKIVLYHRVMERAGGPNGYGAIVPHRVRGAARAARHGAVATLVRSLGTADYRLPHTGALRYDDEVPKIPSAAISAEDADMIQRLLAAGEPVRVRLRLGCRTLPDAMSANVLGEVRGSEKPEEVVVIGAHLDSWDVGHGAHDDGAGVVIVMEAMRVIAEAGRKPRRTIRGVLFTNEENGLRGGRDYAARHGEELHVAAIESDSGGFRPVGFGVTAGEGAAARLGEWLAPLRSIGAGNVREGGGGADIGPLRAFGTPVIGLRHATERYFDYHHTAADTLDKVDREDLERNVAAMAVAAWILADSPETLPRAERGD